MPNYVSKCCKSSVTVSSADEGTNHYVCDKCGNPCDWIKPTPAQRLRREEAYRLKKLENNAKRSKEKGYDLGRNEEILAARKKRIEIVARYVARKRKRWEAWELDFLREHKGGDYSNIAIFLRRSLSSVEHKIVRMGLKKYHSWAKK